MLNYIKWFSNNYKKIEDFKLNYDNLLQSSAITPQNLEDFNNPKYNSYITKLDIFKYITVLDFLLASDEKSLAYNLNPYLINRFNTNNLFPYNEILEVNQYKNIIIDLFFLDIPNTAYKSIPLDILFGEVKNKKQITPYSEDLKELQKMGYGFEYFGKKSMSLYFPLYYKAFYKNITLYSYNDQYLNLSKLLMLYSTDKLTEYSESTRYSTLLTNKIKNYSSLMSKWDNLDFKSVDISTKILTDILLDSSVKQLHFECKDFTSPLDYQELSNSFLSEYCLLYYFEKPEAEDQIDEGVEMYLDEIIDSNLNSKFLATLILFNSRKID